MSAIPIGLQLYSIREDLKHDFTGTLQAVAAMGYAGVEFFGTAYGGYSAKDLKAMLDDLGLRCCGAHVSLAALLGDAFAPTVDFAMALGNPYLIVPSLPEDRRDTLKAWQASAAEFSELARKAKPYGISIGYHNHASEVQPMENGIPFAVFFGNASADVIMQMDIGHVVHGGGDPVALLKAHPGRAVTVHISEYSADGSALVGTRWPRWPEVFAVCETSGKTAWYIVEQESYPYPPLESVRRCLMNLRAMGK